MDEARLIEQILDGSPQAERELYDRYVEGIYRLAFRMTGDEALAEDLTQDTFIRAFDRLGSFRGDGHFRNWLYKIGTSVIFSALRKRKIQRSRETEHEDLSRLPAAAAPDDLDLRRYLKRAVAGLDENHRLVLIMHDLEGFTHGEIASAMGTPVGTAKARLSRARQQLRADLAGLDLGPATC